MKNRLKPRFLNDEITNFPLSSFSISNHRMQSFPIFSLSNKPHCPKRKILTPTSGKNYISTQKPFTSHRTDSKFLPYYKASKRIKSFQSKLGQTNAEDLAEVKQKEFTSSNHSFLSFIRTTSPFKVSRLSLTYQKRKKSK